MPFSATYRANGTVRSYLHRAAHSGCWGTLWHDCGTARQGAVQGVERAPGGGGSGACGGGTQPQEAGVRYGLTGTALAGSLHGFL